MSQQQPTRPQEPVKYGDIFSAVEGELAEKPVAPRDAAMMQKAENAMLGKIQKGAAASAMQSAANKNVRNGFVGVDDVTNEANDLGVSITETDTPGKKIIKEEVGGQVVGQYSQPAPLAPPSAYEQGAGRGITIGEALEATALTVGKKPVEWSDAAAIQAAEVRATGSINIVPGGIAAVAQSAATLNARTARDEDKTKLADILADATTKLASDKQATRRDAEGISAAEMRNDPMLTTHPAGVSASVAAAARLNQNNTS
ncbi:late embryogenesis abundant protein 31-like [Pistacia vera]|uniref:late embryogenesis abundant protein 31-like n=1 Tax=Pistacia vera TaxID=55513 RepID=UPI00126348CB|nr:late embryogenesis abundant protein 31-like [Pistacia vera]